MTQREGTHFEENGEPVAVDLQLLHDGLHGGIGLHHHVLLPQCEVVLVRGLRERHPPELPRAIHRRHGRVCDNRATVLVYEAWAQKTNNKRVWSLSRFTYLAGWAGTGTQ
jgi:hypothetical protein